MTGAQALGGEASAPRPVNTLDLLKLAAVVLMVADHVGLYFAAGAWENPLRIAQIVVTLPRPIDQPDHTALPSAASLSAAPAVSRH